MIKPTVVAAIVRRGASLLMARRSGGSLKGYWEFPGGKVEPNESPIDALRREMREELSVECTVGNRFDESVHVTPNGNIAIVFYNCELLGDPTVGAAHDALAWVTASDWANYTVSPADVPILKKLYSQS